MSTALADELDALLPQTQCTRCGYAGCRPYAEALAAGLADVDQCPPGGSATAAALAARLGRPAKSVNPVHGVEGPPRVAVIDESVCIGCAKCLPVCPTDAIVGAQKFLHTVIAAECTGCELCIPACPVDCIALAPTAPAPLPLGEIRARAARYRPRYVAHVEREAGRAAARDAALAARRPGARSGEAANPPPRVTTDVAPHGTGPASR
ncbi:MAG: RnfABCDGE type electron transport complex subunit B [Steroidobacteraceae bacterium]|jgi:electron transport complex protein RnfB|nr:RnfABCDGE type electron transport complex subunit B [Steroidobacteraceae bacterium]